MRRTIAIGILAALCWTGRIRADEPVRRSVAYLSVEVPRWSRENHCFSCHNNGDAARALFLAKSVDRALLTETSRWLTRPDAWDGQGADGPSKDKRLARLQFALALATAIETGAITDRSGLHQAADRVAADLSPEGFWTSDDGGTVGSPVTYGSRLATAMAIRIFRIDGVDRHPKHLDAAERWLRSRTIENVVEASAVLMIEPKGHGASTVEGRKAMSVLLVAQSKGGGWGPYPRSPVEAFDTALALIALAGLRGDNRIDSAIDRGRSALVAMQSHDGSFLASTRPPGGESYAQGISTTGWATIALLQTLVER
jgi:hypothetical protein